MIFSNISKSFYSFSPWAINNCLFQFLTLGQVLLDIYGTPGSDSNNVDGPENFEDGRAERKASVVSGNSTWDGNEWNVSNDQGYGNGATDAPAGTR